MPRRVYDSVAPYQECPKCRYPMVRWENYRHTPEMNTVPAYDRWWLEPALVGWVLTLGLLALWLTLGMRLVNWLQAAFGLENVVLLRLFTVGLGALGLLLREPILTTRVAEWLYARTVLGQRLRRRKLLALRLAPSDWVCPNCLNVVSAPPDLNSRTHGLSNQLDR